jgi:methylated-DNA-[protein]-cysteine S-methyltransferase
MQNALKYTIFKTKWGYFGLAGTENGLIRSCLPLNNPEKVKSQLLITLEASQFEKRFFKTVQEQITAYFEGACVNFSTDIPIVLVRKDSTGDGLSDFCSSVLTACRSIKFGQVVTYSALAKKLGRPAPHQLSNGDGVRLGNNYKNRYGYNWCGARAVGNALAKNPLPLIIPCHRVVRIDGQLGGFSAPGGMNTKAKLLKHENGGCPCPSVSWISASLCPAIPCE